MIIVSGYNVYPREVEDVLVQAPGISECAVIGVPDAYRGELPVAYVVPNPGSSIELAQLHTFCESHLASYKRPARIIITASLPKTSIGKLDRVALKALTSRVADLTHST